MGNHRVARVMTSGKVKTYTMMGGFNLPKWIIRSQVLKEAMCRGIPYFPMDAVHRLNGSGHEMATICNIAGLLFDA